MKPVIIVNFKTYPSSIGENAVKLAKICEKVAVETGTDIRVAVGATDIYPVSREVTIPVYAEHIDPYPLGRNTGCVLPEMVEVAGAKGTLLNHSEHRLPMPKISESTRRASAISMTTIICAENTEEADLLCALRPDFIAIEPPELIGGDVSVSKAKPELISGSVDIVKNKHNIKLLVGAGVKTKEDVRRAMELGADGILIASGVTLAQDPEKALKDLIP